MRLPVLILLLFVLSGCSNLFKNCDAQYQGAWLGSGQVSPAGTHYMSEIEYFENVALMLDSNRFSFSGLDENLAGIFEANEDSSDFNFMEYKSFEHSVSTGNHIKLNANASVTITKSFEGITFDDIELIHCDTLAINFELDHGDFANRKVYSLSLVKSLSR